MFAAVMMHPVSVADAEEIKVELSDAENTGDTALSSDGKHIGNWVLALLCKDECWTLGLQTTVDSSGATLVGLG